jgi:riboflavin biosynthesis pyrimidine reductase
MIARQLFPDALDEVDTLEVYGVPPGRRHLRANMVSSVDGAAAVDGRVGALSGAADQVLLHELRSLCDVLLVGAGTLRAEGYGGATGPRIAVLTRKLELDLTTRFFTEARRRPIVLTTESAAPHRLVAAAEVADVVLAGETDVGLELALDELSRLDGPRVLSEGGPHVLAELLRAGLVDELCVAIAPMLVGGTDLRITSGDRLGHDLRLAGVLERDEYLFTRYGRG